MHVPNPQGSAQAALLTRPLSLPSWCGEDTVLTAPRGSHNGGPALTGTFLSLQNEGVQRRLQIPFYL